MDIQLSSSKGLTKEFKVVISASDLQTKKMDYIKSRAHKVKLDGFRPGKVPVHVLEQRLGGDAFNHALRTSIDASIKKASNDNNIQYINEPKVDFDEFEEGKDLSFSLTFETMPEIDIKDFSGISLEKLVVDISDKEVQSSLDELHKQHKAFKPEEGRAVKTGDRVACTFSVKVDGKIPAGYKNIDATVDVGSSAFIFSNVDEQIVGLKEGEEKTFASKVNDDYGDKKLAGKNIDLTVKVKQVLAPKTFKIDDEFAKEFGKETLDALKEELKKNLQSDYDSVARLYLKRHLLDELEKVYDILLPESMVKNEFDNIWKHLQNEIAQAKAKNEPIEDEDKSEDEIRAEYEKIAGRRVKLGLVISHIAKTEKIQLTQDELRNAMLREAMRYPGQERKIMEFYRNNPQAIDRVASPLLEDKVVDFISGKIKISEVKVDVPGLKKKVKGVVPTLFDNEDAEGAE